jgi:hypothetical protein
MLKAKNWRFQGFLDAVKEFTDEEGCPFKLTTTYSGRAMYGKTCLGVTFPSGAMLAELYFFVGRFAERTEEYEHFVCLPQERQDSMGLGTIVYWPEVEVTDESDDEPVDEPVGVLAAIRACALPQKEKDAVIAELERLFAKKK